MKPKPAQTILNHVDRRILLYFSVLHTEADLGQMGEVVQRLALKRSGMAGVARKTDLIDMMWTRIEAFFTASSMPFDKMYLYQDGLPVCGRETDIVNDLAAAGSRNHRLLATLTTHGATLMGTESAELLMAEYALAQQMLASISNPVSPDIVNPCAQKGRALLKKRDHFIARRINQTLKKGATGILFIGMLHDVTPGLDGDIDIVNPLNKERGAQTSGEQTADHPLNKEA